LLLDSSSPFWLPPHTAKEPPKKQKGNPAASRVTQYAFPTTDGYRATGPPSSLGTTKDALGRLSVSASPGVVIGDTWWDEQHRGSMGRMIDIGRAEGQTLVHMTMMRLPGWNSGTLQYSYNYYDADPGLAYQGRVSLEWAGYVGCQATGDNRALVGGQERLNTRFQPQFYWDDSPGGHYFGDYISRLPDLTASYGGAPTQELLWPKFRYQEGANDTVLHVVAQVFDPDPNAPKALYYFRKVGGLNSGGWDNPPVIIDTNFVPSHDIAASKTTNKVALVWTANLVGGDGAANTGLEYPTAPLSRGRPRLSRWTMICTTWFHTIRG
jgi:hypothetical protein